MALGHASRSARQAVPALAIAVALFWIGSHDVRAQSILTVAGGGPIGDGKPATDAILSEPSAVTADANGNIYIADTTNHRVRRIDAGTGIITTFAGGGSSGLGDGGPALEAELRNPSALAIGPDGDVFVATEGRVRRISQSTGIISTVAGGGGQGDDGDPATEAFLFRPVAITFDATGNLFIADGTGAPDARVRRVDAETGIISTVAGTKMDPGVSPDGTPATSAKLSGPAGIVFDQAGNLFIAEQGNHRIRKVDAVTGILSTVAGNGNEEPRGLEGLLATDVAVRYPSGLAFDSSGNLFIAELGLIRRVDKESGITTVAAGFGFGDSESLGDGGPARDAFLNFVATRIAITDGDHLLIPDSNNHRIRGVPLSTGMIGTVAGGGPIGDDGPATAALLAVPQGIASDSAGNLYVADQLNYRVRKIDVERGTISTIAGGAGQRNTGDDGPATAAGLSGPRGLDVDEDGSVFVVLGHIIRRIDGTTGIISRIAGTEGPSGASLGDGGPATLASLNGATDVAVDAAGNLLVADDWNHRIRRIDASTGIISTVAGSGPIGMIGDIHSGSFSGDGGPATDATLNNPAAVAVDREGNILIADTENNRVRKVDAETGTIDTVAGGGSDPVSDAIPATQARMDQPFGLALDNQGNLYVAEVALTANQHGSRIRRIDADTGLIHTVAAIQGPFPGGFAGDAGPALNAVFAIVRGLAFDPFGNLFISDSTNNRIRAIYACRETASAELVSPADGAIDLPSAPTLTWSPVPGAFRYDVFLSKEGEVGRTVATDLTSTSFTPQNLELGKTYFWRVRAKGDPFCEPQHESLSPIRAFVTIPPCEPPLAAALTAPADAAVIEDFSTTLAWQAVPRTSSYDVYLGTTLPPPLLFRNVRQTTFTTPRLATGTTYYWSIVARASCDTTLTTQSAIRSFFLAGPCHPAGPFELKTPANDAFNVPTTTTLSWSPSANATTYDLFLGTTNPPAIFLPAMRETSVRLSGLDPNRTYFWRAKATIACDDAKSLTLSVQRFTTEATCEKPGGTTIVFAPPGAVGVGQTYAIAWRDAPGLDAGGTYVVERSLSPSFETILDSQETASTAATFIAESPGTHYHRVRPVTRCNRAVVGPDSSPAVVSVVEGTPDIIFTVEPEAVISRIGRNLEDLKAVFAIENISNRPVPVVLGRAEVESVPFFSIIDPLGGDAVFVTLEPRQPKRFELRFSGPRNDQPGAYQGLVVATAAGSPIIPYAFVNLKVGDQAGAVPEFRVSGTPSEYAFFPGLDGGDADRPPLTVEIRNPGTSPMELGAEVGPEVWLEPEPGWNATPIPAGGVRSVALRTKRNRALNGSALPRYTWFGVRTRTGESARLLVQDNPAPAVSAARSAALDPNVRTFIVPEVLSETSLSGLTLVSRVRLTNLGSEAAQAEIVYTPAGADGFDAAAKRATIVVPPNDVATLTDPLTQVLGASRPARGQLEVRVAGGEIGQLRVESSIVASDRADASFVRMPTVRRGDGARVGLPHQIAGVSAGPSSSTSLVLAETSGLGQANVSLELHDSSGALLGTTTRTVPRYGYARIDGLVTTLGGGAALAAGRLTITVTEGGGAVAAVARIGDASGDHATVLQSSPVTGSVDAKMMRSLVPRRSPRDGVTASLVAPYVLSGPLDASGGPEIATLMGFVAPFGIPIEFHVIFTGASGTPLQRTVSVLGGRIVEFKDVLKDLFNLTGRQTGSILIETDPRGQVYARLVAGGAPASALALAAPVSEIVTQVETARPLALDGLEQSVDASRGARWNVYLQEIAGEAGTVTVRLYEAGNRTHAIAEKQFALAANGRLTLETVFDAMELNTETRRKNRTNVLCVVTPRSGRALFTAVAVEIDNRTGTPTSHPLQPASGVSSTGDSPSLVQILSTGSPSRPRPVRR